jgi:hypothetical protein
MTNDAMTKFQRNPKVQIPMGVGGYFCVLGQAGGVRDQGSSRFIKVGGKDYQIIKSKIIRLGSGRVS